MLTNWIHNATNWITCLNNQILLNFPKKYIKIPIIFEPSCMLTKKERNISLIREMRMRNITKWNVNIKYNVQNKTRNLAVLEKLIKKYLYYHRRVWTFLRFGLHRWQTCDGRKKLQYSKKAKSIPKNRRFPFIWQYISEK